MSALPDEEDPVAADTAAATTAPASEAQTRDRTLYAIPKPEPEAEEEQEPGLVARALADLTPPAFWREPTPPAVEELNRARHGTHLQASGPLRTAAIGWAWIAGVFTVRDKFKIWLRAHPTRVITAVIVLGLLLVSPLRPVVAWILFGLPHLAFTALVD